MQGSKLYVGNLSYSVTEDQLRELFAQHGSIKDLVIIKDKYTERSKGFGFVEFSSPSEAQSAIDGLNGTELQDRALKINEARERPQGNRDRGRDNFHRNY